MSLPEKLIKSAKTGNLREIRKLLGRGVPITKDKVVMMFLELSDNFLYNIVFHYPVMVIISSRFFH